MLLPQPRRELGDTGGGVDRDALQHVDEVGVGIDVVQPARDDQALDDADMLRAEFRPTEIPVLSVMDARP